MKSQLTLRQSQKECKKKNLLIWFFFFFLFHLNDDWVWVEEFMILIKIIKKMFKTYSVCHNDEHRLLLENNRRFLCELAYNDIQIRWFFQLRYWVHHRCFWMMVWIRDNRSMVCRNVWLGSLGHEYRQIL